ncbi:MAG: hypothetical protein FWC09_03360 [Lachnospiraceae bacterium]|nr:hypothetical protein [Lachnospiraceae bacterium]
MVSFKNSKWANQIIDLQKDDGSWGYFHTLSEQKKSPLTTEQALRRLSILGYTFDDKPIQKAISYLSDCLTGKCQIPDRREKLHDWDIFTSLMLSAWIRRFTNDNPTANKTAEKWASVISSAFVGNEYNHDKYVSAYHDILGMKPNGGRLIDFVNFYPISLTSDMYSKENERKIFDYILNKNDGIYYIYNEILSVSPLEFNSKKASRYISAIELLSAYKKSLCKLDFVRTWIMSHQNENGKWDMGGSVNDKLYFPLSDSWRCRETRENDCTYRINSLLQKLGS